MFQVGGINMRSADKDAASKVLTQFCVSQDEVSPMFSTCLCRNYSAATASRWWYFLRTLTPNQPIKARCLKVTLLVSGSTNPRWVTVPRKAVRLCGGNAMGILSEAAAGELQVRGCGG